MVDSEKILIICGPTATGKTALGIRLAKKFNGEIVSADSRQVYKYMDIGTGKDLDKYSIFNIQYSKNNLDIGYHTLKKIPLWLLDIVEPSYRFTVADYIKCGRIVIRDIWRRRKLPIVVGGTGFYIKGLIGGIETLGVAPDWNLRKQLSNLTIEQLREILAKTCPERIRKMNESDRNNPRRLIRAIEIARFKSNFTSEVFPPADNIDPGSSLGSNDPGSSELTPGVESFSTSEVKNFKSDNLLVGLKAPLRQLYKRIDQRVDQQVEMGAEEEIKKLLAGGYDFENSVLGTTIGYREWKIYFQRHTRCVLAHTWCEDEEKLRGEAIQRWKYDEHGYARRQMTWFRKDKRIHWFDITSRVYIQKIENLVFLWYTKVNDRPKN